MKERDICDHCILEYCDCGHDPLECAVKAREEYEQAYDMEINSQIDRIRDKESL